jgi:hypothetical protein
MSNGKFIETDGNEFVFPADCPLVSLLENRIASTCPSCAVVTAITAALPSSKLKLETAVCLC